MQKGILSEVHVFQSSLPCLDLPFYLKILCVCVRIKLEGLVELSGLAV